MVSRDGAAKHVKDGPVRWQRNHGCYLHRQRTLLNHTLSSGRGTRSLVRALVSHQGPPSCAMRVWPGRSPSLPGALSGLRFMRPGAPLTVLGISSDHRVSPDAVTQTRPGRQRVHQIRCELVGLLTPLTPTAGTSPSLANLSLARPWGACPRLSHTRALLCAQGAAPPRACTASPPLIPGP